MTKSYAPVKLRTERLTGYHEHVINRACEVRYKTDYSLSAGDFYKM